MFPFPCIPAPARKRFKMKIEFTLETCENPEVMSQYIKNAFLDILRGADSKYPGICTANCAAVTFEFEALNCHLRARRRRQATGTTTVDATANLNDVPYVPLCCV